LSEQLQVGPTSVGRTQELGVSYSETAVLVPQH
jgi:hypothetical protein